VLWNADRRRMGRLQSAIEPGVTLIVQR